VGVNIGDKFRYDVTPTWSSTDPTATTPPFVVDYSNTEWVEISVTGISGTNITGQNTKHYKNGTETTVNGWVDVDSGNGSLTSFFISANLTAGDLVYTSPFHIGEFINETVPRTYLSEVRQTNHLNKVSIGGSSNQSTNLYWDQLTGVLVDMFIQNTYLTGGYTNSWSVEFEIISSDLWVVPEFPTLTAVLLTLSLLAVVITIYKRRLKPPIHYFLSNNIGPKITVQVLLILYA